MNTRDTSPGELVRRGRADDAKPAIALTFDDGPSSRTGPILDALAAHGARATFFVSGEEILGREAVLGRVVEHGHEIGNHLFHHVRPTSFTEDQLRREITLTADVVRAACGIRAVLVRPPYGDDAARVARVAAELSLGPTVLWSIDPEDWRNPPPAEIARRVLERAHPGAIVDLHDGRRANETPGAVEPMLRGLAERGYRFVTVSELLAL
jgi:peptidoglycan/xylan/chitin deacetylase (PgdA/CDA1 family)